MILKLFKSLDSKNGFQMNPLGKNMNYLKNFITDLFVLKRLLQLLGDNEIQWLEKIKLCKLKYLK